MYQPRIEIEASKEKMARREEMATQFIARRGHEFDEALGVQCRFDKATSSYELDGVQ